LKYNINNNYKVNKMAKHVRLSVSPMLNDKHHHKQTDRFIN